MAADPQDGYATPAAAVICLAISVVAAAVTARGLAEVRLAKAEYARTQAEYILEGAQNEALIAISTTTRPPPYRWSVKSLGETIEVIAEPERAKLSPAAAAALDDAVLVQLGAGDPVATRQKLLAISPGRSLTWIEDQGGTDAWRRCASTYVSGFGVRSTLQIPTYDQPAAAPLPSSWRAGEVWRIAVKHPAGWRDDRIVRFTGDGVIPAAILGRRLSRSSKGQITCEDVFDVAADA